MRVKQQMEFRYYHIPEGEYVLPFLGDTWIREYGIEYGTMQHFHNYLEIGYCYQGDGYILIEERKHVYKGGMFTVIPPNIPHTTKSAPGHRCKWEFIFVNMDAFIQNEMRDDFLHKRDMIRIINKEGVVCFQKDNQALAGIVQSIIRECRLQGLYYKECLRGYLHALVVELLRMDEERPAPGRAVSMNRYVDTMLKYVEENYATEIKMADLAKVSSLSESHMRRIFETCMNMKPADYINFVRIDKACALIRHQEISMEEIGYRVGYETPSTFSRNFKKIMGISPYQWKMRKSKGLGLSDNIRISAQKGWE